MEITWYGHSFFKMAEKGSAVVVTDPFDYRQSGFRPLKISADIVTISHETPGDSALETVQGTPYLITGAGEYEVGEVFITGIQTGPSRNSEETQAAAARNILYVFDFDSLTVAHLGDLDHVLTQADMEAIGTVNIALVPIGSKHGLTATKAAEVISLLEPSIVIPMQFDTDEKGTQPDSLSKFLKEMGVSEPERLASLKISSTALSEETKVVVLENQHG